MTSKLELQQIPELRRFSISWLRRFMTLGLHRFATPGLHRFKIPDLHKFMTPSFAGPWLRIFASLRFRSFTISRFQILAGSRFLSFAGSRLLKTYFMNFIKLGVSRVTGFPDFPNTSPSGKRVDSDNPIPRKSKNFSKKTSPSERRSGHVSSRNLATIDSRRVLETAPPPAPINRELLL
jgi:hypothetical protein